MNGANGSFYCSMKKLFLSLVMAAFALSCSQDKSQKVLVLFYSQTSNTKAVAEQLQAALDADIEEIVAVNPYDGDFGATIDRCRKEMEEHVIPEIQPVKADINSYDVIFLGYPVWFGTYAPPVAALLETTDFSGKKIVPFCTFGSGGLDSSEKALKEKLPKAVILPGYGVRAARMDAVPAELDRFLKAGGYIEGEYTPLPEFSESHAVSEEEAGIFDAAVGSYPMINATAVEAASRTVPEGVEYLFTADDKNGQIKVYVLVENDRDPVFTQVIR